MAARGQPPYGNKGRRCTATRRDGTGERCKNPALKGGMVCRFHGGGSPKVRAAFAANAEAQRVEKAIGRLAPAAIGNPLEELKILAGEVVAWKNALRAHVEKLEELRYAGEHGEQVRGEILLFEKALDRCANVLGLIAKLNIDDRLVAIEEAKVARMLDALDGTLDHLGLPVEQRLAAKKEMARRLRTVA
jgi:hypothetical protein